MNKYVIVINYPMNPEKVDYFKGFKLGDDEAMVTTKNIKEARYMSYDEARNLIDNKLSVLYCWQRFSILEILIKEEQPMKKYYLVDRDGLLLADSTYPDFVDDIRQAVSFNSEDEAETVIRFFDLIHSVSLRIHMPSFQPKHSGTDWYILPSSLTTEENTRDISINDVKCIHRHLMCLSSRLELLKEITDKQKFLSMFKEIHLEFQDMVIVKDDMSITDNELSIVLATTEWNVDANGLYQLMEVIEHLIDTKHAYDLLVKLNSKLKDQLTMQLSSYLTSKLPDGNNLSDHVFSDWFFMLFGE